MQAFFWNCKFKSTYIFNKINKIHKFTIKVKERKKKGMPLYQHLQLIFFLFKKEKKRIDISAYLWYASIHYKKSYTLICIYISLLESLSALIIIPWNLQTPKLVKIKIS